MIERMAIGKSDYYRQRLIMLAHYFPQFDLKTMSDEEFAEWSEAALWFHSQTLMVQQANAMTGLVGGGGSGQ